MKLAEQLKKNKYKVQPLPKKRPAESPAQFHRRKFNSAKGEFLMLLDKQRREEKSSKYSNWQRNFLDFPVNYHDFEKVFEEFDCNLNQGNQLTYTLKKDGWFYKFLLWLQSEGFTMETIKTHKAISWDDSDSYSFRVHW